MNRTTTRPTAKSALTVVRAVAAGLALLAVTVVGVGCAPGAGGEPRSANPATSSSPQPQPSAAPPSTSPDTDESAAAEEPATEGEKDAETEQLLADIDSATETADDYWQQNWSDFFTGRYTAPEVIGLYDTDEHQGPLCGTEPVPDETAFYCPAGHFVGWGDDLMRRALDLGNSWIYFVVAHEWGHAVIAQLDPSLQWEAEELQADCLAGAVLYGAAEDGTITLPDDFTSQMVDNLDALADQTPWTSSADHGDAFERIEAFGLGRRGGVDACLPQE